MNVNTILVPTDFSPSSEAALEYATLLARDLDASLLIAHIMPTAMIPGGDDDVLDPQEPNLREKLASVRPSDPHVAYEHRLGHGVPSHTIVHLAEHNEVDLIVMGAHGETGRKDEPMGAVASHVVLASRSRSAIERRLKTRLQDPILDARCPEPDAVLASYWG